MQAQCADPSSVLPLKEFWFSVSLNNFNKLLNQLIKNAVLTACMGFINDKCQKNSSYYIFLGRIHDYVPLLPAASDKNTTCRYLLSS